MARAFFITGTDTEVGKTTIAAGLLHAARLAGLSTAAVKPVASGCDVTAEGLRNSDALALLGECTLPLRYEEVNPLAFEPAIAPHLAAREVGSELTVAALASPVRRVLASGAAFTVVEGRGLARPAGWPRDPGGPGDKPEAACDSGGRGAPGLHQPCAAQRRSHRA